MALGRVGAVPEPVGLGAHDRPAVGRERLVDVLAGLGYDGPQVLDVLAQQVALRELADGPGVVGLVPVGVRGEDGARAPAVEDGHDVVPVGDAGDPGARVCGFPGADRGADGDHVRDPVGAAELLVLRQVHQRDPAFAVTYQGEVGAARDAVVREGEEDRAGAGRVRREETAPGAYEVLRGVVAGAAGCRAGGLDDVSDDAVGAAHVLHEDPTAGGERLDVAQEAEQGALGGDGLLLLLGEADGLGCALAPVRARETGGACALDGAGERSAARGRCPTGPGVHRGLAQQGAQREEFGHQGREPGQGALGAPVLEQGAQGPHCLRVAVRGDGAQQPAHARVACELGVVVQHGAAR